MRAYITTDKISHWILNGFLLSDKVSVMLLFNALILYVLHYGTWPISTNCQQKPFNQRLSYQITFPAIFLTAEDSNYHLFKNAHSWTHSAVWISVGISALSHFFPLILAYNLKSAHQRLISLLLYTTVKLDTKKKLNSVAVVRKRTIPTERPQLVGEVRANLCG
jgi:hypothetical protein